MHTLLQKKIIVFLLICTVGISIYFFSLFNGFVADDHIYIVTNPHMKQFNIISFFLGSSYYSGDITNLGGIYYKPLFTTITSGLFILSQETPFLFHLSQLLFHICNAFFVFLFFKRYFKIELSFFLSLLFLVHPGNTESVVYIANLQDVLFFFFGMIALLLTHQTTYSYKRYIVIFVFLILSLLSKESGILFLPTLFVLILLKEKEKWYSFFWLILGVFMLYFLMRFGIAGVSINHQAISPIMSADITTRIFTMPKIVYFYILLFFFPKNLSWAHHWIVTNPNGYNFFLPLFVIAIYTCVLFLLNTIYKEKRNTLLLFVAITCIGILLHLQFIPLDFTFADRWFYFPSFGFIGILGILISYVLTTFPTKKLVVVGMGICILVILSIRTGIRTLDWKDDFTLASHDVQVNPHSFSLHNNLGYEYLKKKNYSLAIMHLEKSLTLYPDQSAYLNLAHAYAQKGEKEKSQAIYQKALAQGDYFQTYQNYVAELIRQKDYKKAAALLSTALQKYPNNPSLWLLKATLEYKEGKKEDAFFSLEKAHSLSPGIAKFLYNKMIKNEDISL